MTTPETEIEALLGELRGCHDPSESDRVRVREALGEAVVRQQLAKTSDFEAGGRRGLHLRLLLGSGGSTMVGVMALAAAAAAAVVTLAHPGMKFVPRLVDASDGTQLKPQPEPPRMQPDPAAQAKLAGVSGIGEAQTGPEEVGGCSAWPCLESEPRRALTLAGSEVGQAPAASPASVPPRVDRRPERDRTVPAKAESKTQLEVTPALALDVAADRVTPGAGVRVALPVGKEREVALEATVQHFPASEAEGLFVAGLGLCWRPIRGEVVAALCGRMGYETGSAEPATERPSDRWRLTAGASAELAWNFTQELGVYASLQGVAPIATSSGHTRALGMRVMAGPQLSF